MANSVQNSIRALEPELTALFARIGMQSRDGEGVTRDAFGAAETRAGQSLLDFAAAEGLAGGFDRVGNLFMTLPEHAQGAPDVLIASHIDSVPRGGNYDGLAGVMAGLAVLTAFRRSGTAPRARVRVVGFRGEESPWFGTAYLGSRLFAGQITRAELQSLRRFDTHATLYDHLVGLGLSAADLEGGPLVPLANVKAYYEVHIEQAPLLEALNVPLGAATAIRGNVRYPFAKCVGAYAHSGAVPRHLRSDALLATAKLLAYADSQWSDLIAEGNDDLVFTCGICHTDAQEHAMTKVPGEVTFSLNIGGIKDEVMERLHGRILERMRQLADEHRVRFELGKRVGTPAVALDADLLDKVTLSGDRLGHTLHRMPTVGHDAAIFARAGIPTAVILVRNANGSHNPAEHMEMSDFMMGVAVLAEAIMAADTMR